MKDVFKAILAGGALGLTAIFLMGNGEVSTAERSEATSKPIKNTINLSAPALPSSERPLSKVEINLSSRNMVRFRAEVNGLTVAQAQQELLNKDRALPAGEDLYLVLDTPGGDIIAGSQLADTAKSLHRKVHTITLFAASMGFNLVQRLDTRYILPSGRLMAHRARVGGVEGQVPGEFLTTAAVIYRDVTKMEKQNAGRLGISFEEYTALVKDEYWVDGEDAVRQGAADKLASIKCDKSLDGTYEEIVNTFFGPIALVWANCPAVTAPLGFHAAGGGGDEGLGDIKKALRNYQTFRRTMIKD